MGEGFPLDRAYTVDPGEGQGLEGKREVMLVGTEGGDCGCLCECQERPEVQLDANDSIALCVSTTLCTRRLCIPPSPAQLLEIKTRQKQDFQKRKSTTSRARSACPGFSDQTPTSTVLCALDWLQSQCSALLQSYSNYRHAPQLAGSNRSCSPFTMTTAVIEIESHTQ